jgi:hypothetical protein
MARKLLKCFKIRTIQKKKGEKHGRQNQGIIGKKRTDDY